MLAGWAQHQPIRIDPLAVLHQLVALREGGSRALAPHIAVPPIEPASPRAGPECHPSHVSG
jgi:hypothetical protein